jgi:septum formation protein
MMPSLILASASPRRRLLLKNAGIVAEVIPAHVDESALAGETTEKMVMRLAKLKAQAIARQQPDRIVLGADTTVVLDHHVLGKPIDLADARRMLQILSGRTHEVLTGCCLVRQDPPFKKSWLASTLVTFRSFNDTTIDAYFSLVNPLDKAGAYGIQEHGDMLVERIDGFLSTVIGLPVEEVVVELSAIRD